MKKKKKKWEKPRIQHIQNKRIYGWGPCQKQEGVPTCMNAEDPDVCSAWVLS